MITRKEKNPEKMQIGSNELFKEEKSSPKMKMKKSRFIQFFKRLRSKFFPKSSEDKGPPFQYPTIAEFGSHCDNKENVILEQTLNSCSNLFDEEIKEETHLKGEKWLGQREYMYETEMSLHSSSFICPSNESVPFCERSLREEHQGMEQTLTSIDHLQRKSPVQLAHEINQTYSKEVLQPSADEGLEILKPESTLCDSDKKSFPKPLMPNDKQDFCNSSDRSKHLMDPYMSVLPERGLITFYASICSVDLNSDNVNLTNICNNVTNNNSNCLVSSFDSHKVKADDCKSSLSEKKKYSFPTLRMITLTPRLSSHPYSLLRRFPHTFTSEPTLIFPSQREDQILAANSNSQNQLLMDNMNSNFYHADERIRNGHKKHFTQSAKNAKIPLEYKCLESVSEHKNSDSFDEEYQRLVSFYQCPMDNSIQPEKAAKSGFFYRDNKLHCFACELELPLSVNFDRIDAIHKMEKPNCSFLNNTYKPEEDQRHSGLWLLERPNRERTNRSSPTPRTLGSSPFSREEQQLISPADSLESFKDFGSMSIIPERSRIKWGILGQATTTFRQSNFESLPFMPLQDGISQSAQKSESDSCFSGVPASFEENNGVLNQPTQIGNSQDVPGIKEQRNSFSSLKIPLNTYNSFQMDSVDSPASFSSTSSLGSFVADGRQPLSLGTSLDRTRLNFPDALISAAENQPKNPPLERPPSLMATVKTAPALLKNMTKNEIDEKQKEKHIMSIEEKNFPEKEVSQPNRLEDAKSIGVSHARNSMERQSSEGNFSLMETSAASSDTMQKEQPKVHFKPPVNSATNSNLTTDKGLSSQPLQTSTSDESLPPKYPAMKSVPDRRNTFVNFPLKSGVNTAKLSIAGFFYTGNSDSTRCFQCGGAIKRWSKTDDPFIEHARWFPECQYIKKTKGTSFIQEVQKQHKKYVHSETELENDQLDGNNLENMKRLENKQYAEKDGKKTSIDKENSPPRKNTIVRPKEPKKQKLEHSSNDGDFQRNTPDDGVAFSKQFEQATDGGMSSAMATVSSITINQPRKFINIDEHDPDNMTPEELETIKEENEKLKEIIKCKICLDRDSCIAFLPCGHMSCCELCAPAMIKCPMCRDLIKGSVRAQFPN